MVRELDLVKRVTEVCQDCWIVSDTIVYMCVFGVQVLERLMACGVRVNPY